jgi:membrane protein YqaA with SNARE-associated domain
MHVPLAISVPITDKLVQNTDIVPTILALCGKKPTREFDGRQLTTENGHYPTIDDPEEEPAAKSNGNLFSILFTAGLILISVVLTGIFKEDINAFGIDLMKHYGQDWVDFVLFLLTFISSTPLMLPIWGYVMAGVAMGYEPMHLALVMAVGSALGSTVTYLLGRYAGKTKLITKRFPNLKKSSWSQGRSLTMMTLSLFVGTITPVPCDVLYVAAGLKRYPLILFVVAMLVARFIRYLYLGYGFEFFSDLI